MSVKDHLTFNRLEANVKDSRPELTKKEAVTAHGVQVELGNIDQASWTSINVDLNFPKEKVHKEGETVGIACCIGTVQTTPERLLGWRFHIDSDDNKEKHTNGPNAEQYPNFEISRFNDHHRITYSCRKLPFPLVARDLLQRAVSEQTSADKFVLAVKFIDEAMASGERAIKQNRASLRLVPKEQRDGTSLCSKAKRHRLISLER